MCIKKHAELKYYEFATKIENAVTKPTLEGTAIFMVKCMIAKTTEEISGYEYSTNPCLPLPLLYQAMGRHC